MTLGSLLLFLAVLAAAAYVAGRSRAVSLAGGDSRRLHSLPAFYGRAAALAASVPALLLILLWLIVQPTFLENRAMARLQPSDVTAERSMEAVSADVHRLADGLRRLDADGLSPDADPAKLMAQLKERGVPLQAEPTPGVIDAATALNSGAATSRLVLTILATAAALGGFALLWLRINPEFRARNATESFVMVVLIGCSLIAVLTTIGIVMSLLFESIHFFQIYPASKFLFSTTWDPQFRGGSDLGLWPLVWGTLYVSVIALLVAVPIGLFSAVYLSEYASSRMRSFVKPAIEILAGIPTIVYGLFALVTVGPLLRDWIAAPMGLGSSSTSVATAGIVMGIMVIPFVSSLSDDIINAVPQALRDGSLAIGATPSETVRQVVLPAALPGIVGAVLLAASRAIGETMIVVMGAGAAAKMSLNPFEAMTTVTVKIVSQLTGDTEFASPETLVAFALGLTLFTFTLGLNILAQAIVRRYREQYE
jgi:phosphate transport system permease protein